MSEAAVGTILLGIGLAALGYMVSRMIRGIDSKLDSIVATQAEQGSRLAVVETRVTTGERRLDGIEDRERSEPTDPGRRLRTT